MPTVGKGKTAKKYPYTAAGEKAAAEHARMTGQPMVMEHPMAGMPKVSPEPGRRAAAKGKKK